MFARLYLRSALSGLPANQNEDGPRVDLLQRAAGAPVVAAAFPGTNIKVCLIDAADEIWREANAIQMAAGGAAQIGIEKLQSWVGPKEFPMFGYHAGEASTLRIPRFDATVIEVGRIEPGTALDLEPPFVGADQILLMDWIKEWLP